jgi:predicted transcriptional regulator
VEFPSVLEIDKWTTCEMTQTHIFYFTQNVRKIIGQKQIFSVKPLRLKNRREVKGKMLILGDQLLTEY